ncbi:MAG: hypothetical protein NUV74_06075 [Candidatus Brocadiaceae bacterium]|nr:hypothetical protein [Candidatus Brocadiaceae bacterium]
MATKKELLEELGAEIARLSRTVDDGFDRFSEPIDVKSEDFVASHKEITSALERAAEAHERSTEALSFRIESSLEKHGEAQLQAADIISKSIGKAVDDIIGGVIVGGFLWLCAKGIAALIELVREVSKKTDMILSIQALQKKYPSLSYDFIVERSFVESANKEERQNILNELMHDGIVTSKNIQMKEILCIEPNNPNLLEYWKWIDSIKEEATKAQHKLSTE